MKVLITEKLSEHRYRTPEGYLVCVDAILARTGKQVYKHNQVYDGSTDEITDIEVDRKPEQVFSPQAIASFENKPLTIQHPNEPVTVQNHKDLYHGFARDIRRAVKRNGQILTGSKRPNTLQEGDQEVLVGNIIVTTSDAIEEIENGLEFLSCGYDCDITQTDKPEQINIRGNHIALCDNPRAGITMLQDSINDAIHPKLKSIKGDFFTRENDFKEAVEELGFDLVEISYEYAVIEDDNGKQHIVKLDRGGRSFGIKDSNFVPHIVKVLTDALDSITKDDASGDAKDFLLATYNNYCKGKTYKDIPKMWTELKRVMTSYKNGRFKWSTYSYKYDEHIHAVVSGKDPDYVGSPKVWLIISLDFERGNAKVVHEINNRVSFKQEFTIPKATKDSITEDGNQVSPSSKVIAAVKKAIQELDLDSSVISREYSFMNANVHQTTVVFTKPRFMKAVYEKLSNTFYRVEKGSDNHLSIFEKVKPTGKVLSGLNALQKAGLSVNADIDIDEQDNSIIYYPKSFTSKAIENIRHNLKANENDVYQNRYKGIVIKKSVLDSLTEDSINYVVMCEVLYNGVAVKSRAPWIVFRSEDKGKAEQFVKENNAKTKSLVGFSQHYYIK